MELFVIFLIGIVHYGNCLDNGLAKTPPMGWMSWQRFRCLIDCKKYPDDCISEKLFMQIADRLAEDGYRDAGYEYLIIDDCWLAKERDENGNLQEDKSRFPNGIKFLSDYVHEKGLKFGLYQDYGTKTCAGYPGVLGNEEKDIKQFIEWEVDYIKLDACNSELGNQEEGFKNFSQILSRHNRPVIFSCSWPAYFSVSNMTVNFDLAAKYCNLWRNYADIDDSYARMQLIIKYFVRNQDLFVKYAGPGHWNDPDMLIIGGYGLSYDQSIAQMTIWSILSAPLIMSNDLRNIKQEFKDILLNKDVIAINQDPLGLQGEMILIKNKINIWMKSLSNESYAIGFVSNRTDGFPFKLKVNNTELRLKDFKTFTILNLFELNRTIPIDNNTLTVTVNPTGAVLLKFKPNKPKCK